MEGRGGFSVQFVAWHVINRPPGGKSTPIITITTPNNHSRKPSSFFVPLFLPPHPIGPKPRRCDTQALHLADTQRRVYVVVQTHLQRGDFMWKSSKATVAAAPTWDRNQPVCEFKVEALEASGTLRYLCFCFRISLSLCFGWHRFSQANGLRHSLSLG